MAGPAGEALRRIRENRGVTQAELAHELGFAHGTAIHKRERGEVGMTDIELEDALLAVVRIARRKAGLSLAEVLGG